MPDKLSSLPEHALINVLEYTVDGFTQALGPHPRAPVLHSLKTVALVSRSLKTAVASVIKRFQREMSSLELDETGLIDDECMVEILDNPEAFGVHVRDFRLRMGDFAHGSLSPSPGPGELDEVNIDWDKLFKSMPRLERLDLTMVPLLSRHLPLILLAAAKRCHQLQHLTLPPKSDYHSTVQGPAITNLMTTLLQALEAWFVHGDNGGLKQPTVPARAEDDLFRSSAQYIQGITQFCPNIEYLDGYRKCLFFGAPYCSERWFLTLETWEAFNAACTALRDFDWAVVPFADPYFQVFGNYAKPQLRSLSLSANAHWNYDYFCRHCPGPAEFPEPDFEGDREGYGALALNASAALKGCPSLKELAIEIDFSLNDDARQTYVRTDAYGDAFWEAAATHCPLLEDAMVSDSSGRLDIKIQPFETLTDRTLITLTRLKRLSECVMAPGRFTGKGIFAYLRCVSMVEDLVGKERLLQLQIGGYQRIRKADFYQVILDLLQLLSGTSEGALGAAYTRTRTELHVENPYHWKVDANWSEGYMRDELRPLLLSMRVKHPSLALQVDIVGRDNDRFHRISRLVLDWRLKRGGTRPLFYDVDDDD